jgi:hypothetical protein
MSNAPTSSGGKPLNDNAQPDKGRGRKGITRQSLRSLSGLIGEASAVYRLMKAGRIDHEKGRSLVWVLSQVRAMLEAQALERVEQRLAELGEAAGRASNGNGRALVIEHEHTLPH